VTTYPSPQTLRNVDWAFPTVAAMEAALASRDGFVPGTSARVGSRIFVFYDIGGTLTAIEETPAPPTPPAFNDTALTRLPLMEAAGLLGNPNAYTDVVRALTVPGVLGLLQIETFGNLDAGGFRVAGADGVTMCQVRAGRGTTSASAGVAVAFSPAMNGCNVVVVNGQNDGSDPVAVFSWSSVTGTGFTAHGRLASDGTRVARNFSYIAIGR